MKKKRTRLSREDRIALARILEFGERTADDMLYAQEFAERGIISATEGGAFELTEAGAKVVRAWLASQQM